MDIKRLFSPKNIIHHKVSGIVIRQGRNMVSEKDKLLIGFTPKAGCTVASKLFFNHIGKLEEALAFDPWIHKYRTEYAKEYPTNYWHLTSKKIVRIKFVRNPFTRAVSSYIHAMRNPYEKEGIESFYQIEDFRTISFEQFLTYLESLRISSCNPHHALQCAPGEGKYYKYNHIVKLENLENELNSINEKNKFNLKLEDSLLKSGHHLKKNETENQFVGQTPYLVLTKGKRRTSEIPSYHSFYNELLKEKVLKIYKRDFNFYKYQKTF